ncbi:hypothetical protein FA13DRAFT_1706105 [Coprinellus micaceus]|uniref:Uncharacterized protein n=1 Tax=Coprinellus micaceus TaxID=71717 RepID=A0A4Y7TRW1_COPMI|nr:hypothetical protein FA13DRAFT_1706105 [Coprinellus micaceus]
MQKAPHRCTRCQLRPLMSQCEHTKAGRAFLNGMRTGLASQPPTQYQNNQGFGDLSISSSHPPLGAGVAPYHLPPGSIPIGDQQQFPVLSDPQLALQSRPEGDFHSATGVGQNVDEQAAANAARNDMDSCTGSLAPSDQSITSASSPATVPTKRGRPSKANPFHGHVRGAHQGATPIAIVRKHAEPEPCEATSEAAKAFAGAIGPILERIFTPVR